MTVTDYLKSLPRVSKYVITNTHKKMMTESSWKRMLESYLLKINQHNDDLDANNSGKKHTTVEPFTYHCLRHTFCTILYETGMDVLMAKNMMGHKDVSTTLSIYTHLQEQHVCQQTDKYISSLNECSWLNNE